MLKRVSRKAKLACSGLMLVAVLAGIFLMYVQLSRISEMDVLNSYRQAVEQTAINLNDRMAFAEESLRTLVYDARLQESVTRASREETLEKQLKEIKDLRELVYLMEKGRGVEQIRLYLNGEKLITHEKINFFDLAEARNAGEYARVQAGAGSPVWVGAHRVETTYFQNDCVTLGCLYRTYFSSAASSWALILIDFSMGHFSEVTGALNMPNENARVMVTDASGEAMFGSGDPDTVKAILRAKAPGADACGFLRAPGEGDLAYIARPLAKAGWIITAYMPRSSLLSSRQALRETLILLLFGLTLLMLALAGILLYAWYGRGVRNYIHALNEGLKSGDIPETRRPPASRRALFDLDRNIAELLSTNKSLAEANYRARLREREVTLQALQAQINPHFLYNTLDSINWMALRDGAEDVSDAIATLADYFRLSLSRGRSTVTLDEDIEIVRKYLKLYEKRYDFEYRVDWDIAPDTRACAVPKLTLQPLVENALHHGIFKRAQRTGGVVRVAAVREGERMTLTVTDNGPGLNPGASASGGYGLNNVRNRLDMYFAGDYEMKLENAPGGGGAVYVRVRARETASDARENAHH